MSERNPRTPRIALVVGGCFKAIAQHPSIVDAHRVVYIDAYSETDDVASTAELVPIDLARDETVRSLCARFDQANGGHPLRREHPAHIDRVISIMGCKSVDLAKGLGQVPAVAYLAWQARLEQGLTGTFRAMIDDLTIRAGGQLTRIEVDVFHSNAGATGRGIANAVVETICDLFQGRTVSVSHYVVGRMSFTGLGSHVHDNAPLGVLEDMAFQKHPPTQAKTVHRWLGIELPPVGNDTVLRASYAALWAQAITAPKTRELLDRPQANRSAAAPWGNFTLTRAGWFRSAMNEDDVVAGAARHVLGEIKHLLAAGTAPQVPLGVAYEVPAAPAGELVQGFAVDLQKAAADALAGVLGADGVQAVVQQGISRPEPEVRFQRGNDALAVGSLLRSAPPGFPSRPSGPAAGLPAGRGGAPHEAMPSAARLVGSPGSADAQRGPRGVAPAADLAGLVASLQQARAVREAIVGALEEENHALVEQGDLDRAMRRARANLKQAIALVAPRSLEEHIRALWYPQGRRRLTFLHAARSYRQVAGERAEHEARIRPLQTLLERADDMIRTAQEPFVVLRRALERLLAQLPPPVDDRSVRYHSLGEEAHAHETVFEVLLRAARTDNPERLYQELRATTRGVTLDGLASILKLGPDANPLAVVNRLDKSAEVMGPYWGGMPRPDAELDQRIRVLPPLEGDLYRELLQAKDEIASDIQLVCAQSMAAGIGIVCIDTYLVKEWYDLLTPEYQQDLLATLSSPEATALAHVPGSQLYVDGVFEALHFAPGPEVKELLETTLPRTPVAAGEVAAPILEAP